MRGKRSKSAISFYVLLALVIILLIIGYINGHNIAVLNPAGPIAHKERNLIWLAMGLCAIVVVPVFTLAIWIPLKYREGNKRRKKYSPEWDSSHLLEGIWWAIPFAIITALGIVTWNSSYSLDPYKALAANQAPLRIQVISLDWKWLFIYPGQNLASVNWLELPLNQPVQFDITSDSVMNSFWIPSLGSQIYAMPGMNTRLNLLATKAGDYLGRSANISGSGFASMQFTTHVVSAQNFAAWTSQIKNTSRAMNTSQYKNLSKPSQNVPPAFYAPVKQNLYLNVVSSYIGPLGRGMGH